MIHLIVFMSSWCLSHKNTVSFDSLYIQLFDLLNLCFILNFISPSPSSSYAFQNQATNLVPNIVSFSCNRQQQSIAASSKKQPPVPNVPNTKCANCAGAKSAKARFEFLPLAGAGIGFAGARAPNCVTCHSRRNEPDMSSSRIGSKTPSSPSVHPPVSSFSSYCANVREDRTGRSEMNTTPPPCQWHCHPQSAEDIECTLHTHGSLNSRRMYPPPLSVLGSIGGALLRG